MGQLGTFRRIRSSDGRIRIKTLSGVSALVAVIALLVGVLPVVASHGEVDPSVVNEGGGSGKCFVETGGLPSVAGNEFHINNPTPGSHSNGVIDVEVYDLPEGRVFNFDVVAEAGIVVYDVVVNGGPKANHYDYDAVGGPGPVSDDDALHAPSKNRTTLHNLSHINICYDVPGLTSIPCDVVPPIKVEGEGILTLGEVTIFKNSLHNCTDKGAQFFIEDDVLTLEFLGDGTDIVAGRLDIHKDFGAPPFVDLLYQRTESDDFVPVQWCEIRAKDTTPDSNGLFDGDEFDDVLETDQYPSLIVDGEFPTPLEDSDGGDAISCKVHEGENAAGIQVTVVYFELEDPQWK